MAMTAAARAAYDALWLAAFVAQEEAFTAAEIEEAYWEAQGEMMEAERRAEMGYERYLEDRGWMEAEAERAWEDSRGVVQFSDAMAQAMGYEDADDRFAEEAHAEDEAEARAEAEVEAAGRRWLSSYSPAGR